jgi:hypothetical protein
MKKNRKLIFIIVLLFPAMFKLILEFTTINSKKLSYFGPKEWNGKDTAYYSLSPTFKQIKANTPVVCDFRIDTLNYPLFAICFIKQSYQNESYRLAGLSEFIQYKKDKIKYLPFIIVTPCSSDSIYSCFDEFQKLKHPDIDIQTAYLPDKSFDSINRLYFKEKPIHIDYSFFVLMDKKRNIRGYYDARYVSEIKRLTEEYQHLRLKEEKQQLINANKIETK